MAKTCTVLVHEDKEDMRCGEPALPGVDRCRYCAESALRYAADRIASVESAYADLGRYRDQVAHLKKALGK